MKKTYIFCRAHLLIGLFALHILSSCVNTRVVLGVKVDKSKEVTEAAYQKQRHALGFCDNPNETCSYCHDTKISYVNQHQNSAHEGDKSNVNTKKFSVTK